jgi:shikimate kinase
LPKSGAITTATLTTFVPFKLLFLTGFMGSGKSTIGKRLARTLGISFVDLDAEIVQTAGQSIRDIFEQEGEAVFRKKEQASLRAVCCNGECAVVATGGGAVVALENRRLMRESGLIINLQVDYATIAERLAGDFSRPLLRQDEAAVLKLMADRASAYADADICIDTVNKSPFDVVSEIMDWLQYEEH